MTFIVIKEIYLNNNSLSNGRSQAEFGTTKASDWPYSAKYLSSAKHAASAS